MGIPGLAIGAPVKERNGLENVLAAVAGISAIVALNDLIQRQKTAREAIARHRQTVAILQGIDEGVKKLNEKLGK